MTPDDAMPHRDAPDRDAWRRGARAALPLVPGAVLFGLATGAATVSAGVSQSAAFAMPASFYSGVAQLAYTQLVAVGAPFASLLLSVALTHLRYLICAAIASTWPRPPGLWPRIVGAYFVSESSFALALQEPLASRFRYMIGAGLPLWFAWFASGIVGTFLAGYLPPLKHAYAVPAIVLAPILAKQLTGRLRLLVAVAAVMLGLALVAVPMRLGPLTAALLAVGIALFAARLWRLR